MKNMFSDLAQQAADTARTMSFDGADDASLYSDRELNERQEYYDAWDAEREAEQARDFAAIADEEYDDDPDCRDGLNSRGFHD